MKKTIRLTESELVKLVKKIINEDKRNVISEQTTLLNINPQSMLFTAGDTSQQIKLKGLDPKTKKILVLKYNIKGQYGKFNFGVVLKNIRREPNGNLTAQAKPSNSLAAFSMRTLVPDKNLTEDGWLNIEVPNEKINEAIAQLRKNYGSSATIDAGQGVTILLSLAS